MQKNLVWVFLTIAASQLLCGCQTLADYLVLPKGDIRVQTNEVRVERDFSMLASDGTKLVSDIYFPIPEKQCPTILVRIPFSQTFKNNLGANAIARFWASRGYIVVVQGTRGRFKSGGDFYPLIHEREDGLDTLHWLAKQPWFDGRLGMWGGSAFGYTQWVLADQHDPGPSALIIQIASSSFYDMFYPGGAFSLESALFWAVRSRGAVDEDPSFTALERGFGGFPLNEADDRAVGDIPFFNDWASHRQNDSYWKHIDGEGRAGKVRSPVLLMAGWSDPFLPSQLKDYATIKQTADTHVAEKTRLIIGPWTHADAIRFPDGSQAGDYRPASLEPSIPWFDDLLLGKRPDEKLISPVKLYVMGENVWRNEQEWPLARTRYVEYFLRSAGSANSDLGNGRLVIDAPDSAEPPDSFAYDPNHPVPSRGGAMLGPRSGIKQQNDVESRNDMLVYSTDQLQQDTEVTGSVRLLLYVATSAINTDFTAKLVDVYPDGKSYNVTDGILRRDYPPSAYSDGAVEVTIELWPTSQLFRKGHKIRLDISSSNFPRYDRNPNTGKEIATEINTLIASQQIFHDGKRQSRLVLPVIPRPHPDSGMTSNQ